MKQSILYVEDDAGSRKVMQGLIDSLCLPTHLIMFEDSANFIQRIEHLEASPDVFLLDINVMPLDGFAMLRLLRDHPLYRDKTIIALTASVMNEEVQELKASGFDGVLAKPLRFREFPDVMRRIFDGERIWKIIP